MIDIIDKENITYEVKEFCNRDFSKEERAFYCLIDDLTIFECMALLLKHPFYKHFTKMHLEKDFFYQNPLCKCRYSDEEQIIYFFSQLHYTIKKTYDDESHVFSILEQNLFKKHANIDKKIEKYRLISFVQENKKNISLPNWFIDDYNEKNNIINYDSLLLVNNELNRRNEEFEKQLQESPRKVDEKCLGYLLTEKIPELKGSKDWKEYMKGNTQKGAILKQMENNKLKIDAKSFESMLERVCNTYNMRCKSKE